MVTFPIGNSRSISSYQITQSRTSLVRHLQDSTTFVLRKQIRKLKGFTTTGAQKCKLLRLKKVYAGKISVPCCRFSLISNPVRLKLIDASILVWAAGSSLLVWRTYLRRAFKSTSLDEAVISHRNPQLSSLGLIPLQPSSPLQVLQFYEFLTSFWH